MSTEHYIIEQNDFCKLKNQYTIWTSDQLNVRQDNIGGFQEEVSAASRIFCCSSRAFQLNCDYKGDNFSTSYSPFKFCCWQLGCCPPEMIVTQKEIKIGAIRSPQSFYSGQTNSLSGILLNITDKKDNTIYTIQNRCCELGYLCGCVRWFTKQGIEYSIMDAENKVVGKIVNMYISCPVSLFTTQDKFSISFPEDIPLEHKKLLLNSVILLDFLRWQFK